MRNINGEEETYDKRDIKCEEQNYLKEKYFEYLCWIMAIGLTILIFTHPI